MTLPDLITAAEDPRARADINAWLAKRSPEQRVEWALRTLPQQQVLSSSFGAQSALCLHLVTQQAPATPVILVDTGYLFPETYRFIDTLSERLGLKLHVVNPQLSPGWLEARHGRLWEQGIEGIERYNRLAKVEPLQRALRELGALTWIAGLRRSQSDTRSRIDFLELRDGRWKLHPVADLNDRQVWDYLRRHELPYHPLWHEGYVSIGDTHTTRPFGLGMREQDTRFFGLKRECGIHGLDG